MLVRTCMHAAMECLKEDVGKAVLVRTCMNAAMEWLK